MVLGGNLHAHQLQRNRLRKKAQNNSMDNFKYPFYDAFINIVLDRMAQNETFFNKALDDDKFQQELKELMLPVIYERLRAGRELTN